MNTASHVNRQYRNMTIICHSCEALYLLTMVFVCMVVCRFIEAIMSIPPLLSSTPPPLEENGSMHDHDDDFGEFSDHVSEGAVSSTTSIPDSSGVFRPVETSKLSGGLYESDTNLNPDGLEDINEWSEFDCAVVEPSSEPMHIDSADMFGDDKNLVVDVSVSRNTDELPTASPSSSSSSQVIISEQLNLGDVSSSCYTDAEIKCNYENSYCKEQTVGKFHHDWHEDVNTVSEDAIPQCRVEEIRHPADDNDEVSLSASDNQALEFHTAVDSAGQENDSEDNNSLRMSPAVSNASEHAFGSDKQPASDENDFVDFQSFSNDVNMPQESALDEAQPNTLNNEDSAFISYEEQDVLSSIETSAIINLGTADSQPLGTSCSKDCSSSFVKDSTAVAKEDEIMSTNQHFTHEEMLVSRKEVNDDFDDFEEFVAAKEGPDEHQPAVDSGAYQWNAFENTDADDDDWAAFQDSDQTVSSVSRSEVYDSDVAVIQQPVMAYSGQLSKVQNCCIVMKFLTPKLTHVRIAFA